MAFFSMILRQGAPILFVLVLCLDKANGFTLDGKVVSEIDIRALPPLCKLIVIDHPGSHHGAGSGPLDKDLNLFSGPEYKMAVNNPHIHHWCWSILQKFEYFRAKNSVDRDRRYREVIGNIDYVIENTNKNWQFFHVMYAEQAIMMLYHQKYSLGLVKIEQAIEINPKYARAYAIKSDIYIATGNKKLAIKTLQEGLENVKNSKLLEKRLELLGIKVQQILISSDKELEPESEY